MNDGFDEARLKAAQTGFKIVIASKQSLNLYLKCI